MAKQKCVIISGGPVYDYGSLTARLPIGAYIIGADSGYAHAANMGLECDLFVGDADSVDAGCEITCEKIISETKKDDTDLMLAAREGLKRGFASFIIADSLSGRIDHILSNIQVLYFLFSSGCDAKLLSPQAELQFIRSGQSLMFEKEDYSYFSVLAYDGEAKGVDITGAKYPLINAALMSSFPIGQSNEFSNGAVTVSVGEGTVLLIKSKE